MMKKAVTLSMAGLLGACASMPDVTYTYYPGVATTSVAVTQTISCTTDKTDLIFGYSAPQVTTANSADRSNTPYTLTVKKLDNAFADSDFTFTTTDDGRLKSINASFTGQGEAVLKSAISLGAALAAAGGGAPSHAKLKECDAIANWGGGKPISLVYNGKMNPADGHRLNLEVAQDATSLKIYNALNAKRRMPQLQVVPGSAAPMAPAASYDRPHTGYSVWLHLQKVVTVPLDLREESTTIYTSVVTVPTKDTYDLPIPGAALFGKQGFALTLNDSGAITSIDYGKTTGAAGAVNVVVSATTAATPSSK
jgi:hypothetical protein